MEDDILDFSSAREQALKQGHLISVSIPAQIAGIGFPTAVTRAVWDSCIKVPPGEAYSFTEGGNGELGFYIVSDGSGRPYKNRCRPPCFYTTAALRQMILGANIADVVPIFGSLNMIGGDGDR